MNEVISSCEWSEELVSFLYGELDEREAMSFEQHRQNCKSCDEELKAFGPVRQSILSWRDQSLGLATSLTPRTAAVSSPGKSRSAVAAIREYLALAPLWMKGATAFASLLFAVLTALAVGNLFVSPQQATRVQGQTAESAVATEQKIQHEVQRRLGIELAKRNAAQDPEVVKLPKPPSNRRPANSQHQIVASTQASQAERKPLTRAERDQLAADLRLVTDEEDDSFQLLGDRINK